MDRNPSNQPQKVVEMSGSSSADPPGGTIVPTWISTVPVTRGRRLFRASRNDKHLVDTGVL